MSRRFRPFYVAAAAVVMVGLFGTEVVPKSNQTSAPEAPSVSAVETVSPDNDSGWLGPLVEAPTGLLDLTPSFLVLPFDIGN